MIVAQQRCRSKSSDDLRHVAGWPFGARSSIVVAYNVCRNGGFIDGHEAPGIELCVHFFAPAVTSMSERSCSNACRVGGAIETAKAPDDHNHGLGVRVSVHDNPMGTHESQFP